MDHGALAMDEAAMIQVLGAIAYGELGAHQGAKAKAQAATDDKERRRWHLIAEQELRHYNGFTARLAALGADPEAAMAEFRPALDSYRGTLPANDVEEAVWAFLGEGIADDLMVWFKSVVDADLAAFVASVLADEEEHEGQAAATVRATIGDDPENAEAACAAAQTMVDNMIASGGGAGALSTTPLLVFLRIGRADELMRLVMQGFARRLREIGIDPRTIRTPFRPSA